MEEPSFRTWSVTSVHEGRTTIAVIRARTMLAAIERFFTCFPGHIVPAIHLRVQWLRLGLKDEFGDEREEIAQISDR